MRGISISRVTTSGDKARILSRAINGSGAVPITSIPDSADSASVSSLRTMAESSTIRTLIFLSTIIPPLEREEGNECSFGELEAAGGWRSDSKVRTWFVRADMDRLRSAQIEDDVRFHLADHCAAHHIGDLPHDAGHLGWKQDDIIIASNEVFGKGPGDQIRDDKPKPAGWRSLKGQASRDQCPGWPLRVHGHFVGRHEEHRLEHSLRRFRQKFVY